MRTRTLMLSVMVSLAIFFIGSVGHSPSQVNAAQAPTTSAANFYKNSIVTIIIPSRPGGGTDLAARLFNAYWNQYTGGYIKLVNESGGGGLVGVNQAFSANPDGLTMGVAEYGSDIIGPAIAKPKGLLYDPSKFNFIGLFGREDQAFALSPKLPYNTIDELKKAKSLVMAGQAMGGDSNISACLVAEVLGIKGAVSLYGHESSSDIGLAMATGELEAYAMTSSAVRDQVAKGLVKKPLLIVSTSQSKNFPGVPALSEVAQLTPDQRKVLNYITKVLGSGKAFYMTPGVPADRVEFLRDVFDKIVADKAFISQASLRWPAWEKPIPGKELEKIVSQAMMSATPEDIKLVSQLVEKYKKK